MWISIASFSNLIPYPDVSTFPYTVHSKDFILSLKKVHQINA